MNFSIIRYILFSVLSFEGIFFLLPSIVGGIYGEKEGVIYLCLSVMCMSVGFLGRAKKPKSYVFYAREGFAAVSLSWILISLIGAIPFVLTKEIPSYIDALFETISGFTTTGSSILSDVEALSKCNLFWRSFTHWVGGMGVLVFVMAILPSSGSSNVHLMRAESPGPSVGKLVPKIKQTAMILYEIYIVITLVEIVLLFIAGLPLFEAFTITFGTVGTGGFGVLNTSTASYSFLVQGIITVFMIICAINFNIYYLLLIRKPKEAILNEELRWFLIIVFASAIMITINIKDGFANIFEAFHTSLFQVATVISTTGFSTADFNMWPEFSKTILFFLMMIGACAGSTGGGFKISRVIIVAKSIKNEILAAVHPRSVKNVQINSKKIQNNVIRGVLCYLAIYVAVQAVSILIVSLDNFDMTTNISAVIATFNNIGPGFNVVGPTGNFGSFGILSKFVMMFDMLVGRLELLPMLVLFTPGMWKLPSWRKNKVLE